MATLVSELTTWSQTDTANADWNTPNNARALDGTAATFSGSPPLAGTNVLMETLQGLALATPVPYGAVITEIRLKATVKQTDATPVCSFVNVYLCDDTGALTTVDNGTPLALDWTTSYQTFTFTFTAANIATLALTLADVNAATFGCQFIIRRNDTVPEPAEGSAPFVDAILVEVDYNAFDGGPIYGSGRFRLTDSPFRAFKGRK